MTEESEFGDKYRLVWQKSEARTVGYVYNYSVDGTAYRRIPIFLDDDLMKRIKMRFIVSTWKETGPEIYLSAGFLNLPHTHRKAGVWHEVGHIHHEHLRWPSSRNQQELRTARLSETEKGNVPPLEAQADNFAVMRVGNAAMIGFLEFLARTREIGEKLGWNELSRREFKLRIAAICALESDYRMKLYFAYGSNMSTKQMRERCPNRRLISSGVLLGYRWIISERGYANIIRSALDRVYGVVYEISPFDERELDGYEGVNSGCYRKELLSVEIKGRPQDCLVYVDPTEGEGSPRAEYVDRINQGIADADLPADYVERYIRKFMHGSTSGSPQAEGRLDIC